MGTGTRPDRVAEEFREVLAEEIPKLKDPGWGSSRSPTWR